MSLLIAASLAAVAPVRPNVVYIMADDLGYRELGCYGQKKIPTPNFDRLAAQGCFMTRFYAASPVCAPTRCSLLTGKHQGHAAIRGNKEQGGWGINAKEGQAPIPAEERLLPEVLQQAGYRTGLVGKWGLGGTGPGENPLDHGFDSFYGYLCQRRAHSYYPAYLWDGRDPQILDNPVYDAHTKIDAPLPTEDDYYARFGGKTHSAQAMAAKAVEFVKKESGTPFFLYYAPTLPHLGLQAPREWVEKFPREWDAAPYLGQNGYVPCARPRATYAAMIAYLDHTVGEIMKALEEIGQAENTLIVFTSDNGAADNGGVDRAFFQSNGELRAGKMSVYEGGIRVPFVVRWPGRIAPGIRSDQVGVCYDVMATVCQAAGVRPPKNDGISLLPALEGGKPKRRSHVYFEYPEASCMQAVILDGLYKVVRPTLKKDPARTELYDLDSDPGEQRDLSRQMPDLVKRGLAAMAAEHVRNPEFPLPGVD